MPLEPGVTIHVDAMASHFGQKHKKTKQQKRKPQTNHTASEHPSSTLPGPMFAFHWGWQFVVRDSRLHLSENVVGTLFSGGGSLSFATQDCTLLKMPSLPVFFFRGRGRRHPTKGHFFSCGCLLASMARSVNCHGRKSAVQVHLIGAKPIVQVKRWNER